MSTPSGSKVVVVRYYLGAAFCAFLSMTALIGSLFTTDPTPIAFVAFLPMCFLFVGFAMHELHKRIEALEARARGESAGVDETASGDEG